MAVLWNATPAKETIIALRSLIENEKRRKMKCGFGGTCRMDYGVCCAHHGLCAICFNPRSFAGLTTFPGCTVECTKKIKEKWGDKSVLRCQNKACNAIIDTESQVIKDVMEKKLCIACIHDSLSDSEKDDCSGCAYPYFENILKASNQMRDAYEEMCKKKGIEPVVPRKKFQKKSQD